jgi:hypothetical protein
MHPITCTRFLLLALLFPFAWLPLCARAENWILFNESTPSTGPQKTYIDSDSYRSDFGYLTYLIKIESNWFDSRRARVFTKVVLTDCRENRRFEAADYRELGDRNFKSVYPGTSGAKELAVACQRQTVDKAPIGSIPGTAVAVPNVEARQQSVFFPYFGEATDACFQQLHGDVRVKILSNKIAFDLDKPQSMELLGNLSKPNAKEKAAIDYFSMEWQRCYGLDSEWRQRNLSPDVNALLSAFKLDLISGLADLYSGQISYGTAAKLRAKQWVDFKKNSEAVSRRLTAQSSESEMQRQDQLKRSAALVQERAAQDRARQQEEANQRRAAETQRREEQEQTALRAQWAQQQQDEARQRVASCMAAMYARPTKTGSLGESMANAAQCNSDSNAHLVQLPANYTCKRDFRGAVQCTPQ